MFSIEGFFSKCDQIAFTVEIRNGKLHFLCSVRKLCPGNLLQKMTEDVVGKVLSNRKIFLNNLFNC